MVKFHVSGLFSIFKQVNSAWTSLRKQVQRVGYRQSYGVNKHTAWYTSPVSMVSWRNLVFGWELGKQSSVLPHYKAWGSGNILPTFKQTNIKIWVKCRLYFHPSKGEYAALCYHDNNIQLPIGKITVITFPCPRIDSIMTLMNVWGITGRKDY